VHGRLLEIYTALPYISACANGYRDGRLSSCREIGTNDKEEQFAAENLVASDPEGGVIMQGTEGVRKARLAGRGKGKSGGYRVVWYFGGGEIPVFLLTVFGKDQKANLSPAERTALRSLVVSLRDSLA